MNKLIKHSCVIGITGFMVVCAYYILHQAFWLPGDEAIVMEATGWGHAFIPPREPFSIGRFFPFSYSLYNLLLLFPHGAQVSTTSIYLLQTIALIVYASFIALFSIQIMNNVENKWRYPITLFVVIFAVSRIYQEFTTCYTAVWMVFFLLPIFLWCSWKFSQTKRTVFAVIAVIITNYIIYCYETVFTIPITIGTFALVFNFRNLSKKEIVFYSSLIASSLIFLLLYIVLVIPQTEVAYDGAHGSDASILENALKIFIAQKTLWVVAILLAYRVYDCFKNKAIPCFFDILLLSSCAYCCGAAALRLNFTYYYNAAVIAAIPAILYFSLKYIKTIGAICVFGLFAVFYGVKVPKTIITNQKSRKEYKEFLDGITDYVRNGESTYWYSPEKTNLTDYDCELRSWRCGYTFSGIGWVLVNETFEMPVQEAFTNESGLWFVDDVDSASFNKSVNSKELIHSFGGINYYRVE